jgi:putative transposase
VTMEASSPVKSWTDRNGVKIDFSRPGNPTDNAFVESSNGIFWGECLNSHWFDTPARAKRLIEEWRQECNETRPHTIFR